LSIAGLQEQFNTLTPAIAAVTGVVNARGETQVERLQDMPDHVWEIVLHGIRSGAAGALAATQLRHGAQLSEHLAPDFVEECNNRDFDELVEEFAPCTDAMAQVSSSADIISRVFDDED